MSIWHDLFYRAKALGNRKRAEREQLEELEFHLAMETEKNERQGMDPIEARRRARAAFGGFEAHREALRDGRGFPFFENFAKDLNLAIRGLLRAPLFTAVVVVTLAVGISATGAMFSAVNEVLLRPLPYEEPNRLVVVTSRHRERNIVGANISHPDFLSWQNDSRTFASLGAFTGWTSTITGEGLAERISGAALSPEVFSVLGIEPTLGRGFRPRETILGFHHVVVLSHGMWRQRFGGEESILGEQVTLDGEPHTIIGVMPPGFRFPHQAEAWVPLAVEEPHRQRGARFLLGAIGRLESGTTLQDAQQELESVCDGLAIRFPASNEGWDAQLMPLIDNVVGPLGPALWILQAAAALVFLVVCGNVAGMLLARGRQRRQEFVLRSVLGAGRKRLMVLLLTESLVLAWMGAIGATPLLMTGIAWLRALLVDRLGVVSALEVNPTVLVFVLATSLLATLLFGLLPALSGTKIDTVELGGTRSGASRQTGHLRQVFVIAQLALVVVLLVGAALLIQSLEALGDIDPGFEANGVVGAQVSLPSSDYPNAAARDTALANILQSVRAVPGVEAVEAAQGLPFSGWNIHNHYQVEGEVPPAPGHELVVHVQTVTSGFHDLLDIEHLRGRPLRIGDGRPDSSGAPQNVAVVNQSFVDRHFKDLDPIGERLRFGTGEWITIVGVVADYRHFDLVTPMRPAVYLPWSAWSPENVALALRTSRDLEGLLPELRQALARVAPNVPPYYVEPLTESLRRETFNAQLVRDLLVGFASVSAVLALIGLYGVISFTTATRRREFGVRIALGATPLRLAREIMQQSARLSVLGVALGLLATMGATGFLTSLLFGVKAHDPPTFLGIATMVLLLAGLATWLPARRESRRNPVEAIHCD